MNHKRKPGTLGGLLDEIRDGTYTANARWRASRRKSAWNLLLPLFIFPLWLALWGGAVEVVWLAHVALLSGHVVSPSYFWMRGVGPGMTAGRALLVFPLLVPALTAGMVVSNFLIYLIPPARRAMDAEDQGFPGTDYKTAQTTLGRLTAIAFPIAAILACVGATLIK